MIPETIWILIFNHCYDCEDSVATCMCSYFSFISSLWHVNIWVNFDSIWLSIPLKYLCHLKYKYTSLQSQKSRLFNVQCLNQHLNHPCLLVDSYWRPCHTYIYSIYRLVILCFIFHTDGLWYIVCSWIYSVAMSLFLCMLNSERIGVFPMQR